MPGFRRFLRNSLPLLILPIALGSAAGCKASEAMEEGLTDTSRLNSFIRKYELQFNPAVYDVDVPYLRRLEAQLNRVLEVRPVFTTTLPDTVPGFRVQVLLTGNIDRANSVRDTLELLEPDEWTYITFDAPYYKVRIGNFTDRSEATEFAHHLGRYGFTDAWVVPDHVIINLPPKPPSVDIVPEPRLTESH